MKVISNMYVLYNLFTIHKITPLSTQIKVGQESALLVYLYLIVYSHVICSKVGAEVNEVRREYLGCSAFLVWSPISQMRTHFNI